MSNAMRSGKRTLAGVAAGALALGALAFAGTTTANAQPNVKPKLVNTITQLTPGLSIVKPAVSDDTIQRAVPISVALTDATGAAVDLESFETLQATVFAPDAAVGTNSTSFALAGNLANLAGINTFANVNLATNLATDDTGIYTVFAYPRTTGTVTSWNTGTSGVPAGTYTVRILYTNNNTGATQAFNVPVQVLADTARPTATMSWVGDAQALSTINAASAVEDDTVAPQFSYMTTAAGFPIVGRPSLVVGTTSINITGSTTALNETNGFSGDDDTTAMNTAPGVTRLAPAAASDKWTSAASANYIAAYGTQTSSLPIVFGELTAGSAGNGVTGLLTTTPNNLPSVTPQVPAGTQTISFLVSPNDDTMSGTFAWAVETDAGQVTPSAGVAVVSNNQAIIQVALDATAAARGNNIRLISEAWVNPGTMTPYQVTLAAPSPVLTVPATQIAKLADPVTLAGTVTDQFGRAVTGTWLVSVAKQTAPTTVLASGSTAADGTFSLTIPAAASPTSAGNVVYVSTATNGSLTRAANTTVTYNATGDITSLSVATLPVSVGGLVPAVLAPGTGTTTLTTVTAAAVNPSVTTASTAIPVNIQNSARITPTAVPATTITVTAPEGVYLSRTVTGQVNWNGGAQTITVNSGTTLSVWSTKAGLQTINFTAGGKTATAQVYTFTDPATARNIALSPATATLKPNEFVTLTATISDVFGNPLRGVTSSQVALGLAGGGTISPTAATGITATNAAGQTTIAYTSPAGTGTAQVSLQGLAGQFTTTITGASAAQALASTTITVATEATKTIIIVGERTTVSGKPGILVDGTTKGFDVGTKLVPNVRFPGQTTFTAGSARPTTSASGEFSWQRKTGKKTTVFFTNEAGDVVSNRVTIPAN